MAYSIPNVPGVPALLGGVVADFGAGLDLLTSDAIGALGAAPAQWGIFQGGAPVVTADTVASFDYKQEWIVADYPVEQGAFESYDKVARPYDARVTFVAGGSAANREALLSSIAAIAGALNLYDVITPEATYESVTISHYDYKRTAQSGLGLLQVNAWCTQIIVTVPSGQFNTQSPSGSDQVNGGAVQPTAPTSNQVQTLNASDVATAGGIP